jgi:ubiquinone biosynthesis protein
MKLSLQPRHLRRYRDIARLLWKYGRSDLVKGSGLVELLEDDIANTGAGTAEAAELVQDLENLGPTFIKLGQLFSTRPDLIPAPYAAALERLQDRVAPFPFEEVESVITAELGIRIGKAFREFDPSPLAAASLGQVHRAELRDGRRVAVKVQRPGMRAEVVDDLEVLDTIARWLETYSEAAARYELRAIVEQFGKTILRELDYRAEAQNLALLRRNLAAFTRLSVPAPIADYTTGRVLTMEYVTGTKITALSPVVLVEIDVAALTDELFAAYLQQILVDGFFHADPHPGNVVLTPEGRLAFLDLGMVARVTPRAQDHLLQLMLAISTGRADDAVGYAQKLGEPRPDFDERQFTKKVRDLVVQHQETNLGELRIGRLVLEVTRVSAETGLRLPPELVMLGKTLLNLDEIARQLDPEFDPNAAVRRHASSILPRRLLASLSTAKLFSSALETKELLERLPDRLNKILDRLAQSDFRVRVEALDEKRLMTGFQKIANRITLGILLAALILGAAMLMQVETPFQILGYPGLAIVFFVLAAIGALALIVTILLGDD